MALTTQSSTYETKKNYQEILTDLITIVGGSLFIALCAQIKIPLGFTPVPITLQTLAVMIVGGFLGSRKGTLCVLLYLAEISMGLPVAAGGISNPLALIGLKGGYLIGMIAQAYLTGWIYERAKTFRSFKVLFAVFLISILQMGIGAFWLGMFVGMKNSLYMGFYPFLPGDIIKCIATVTFLRTLQD